MILTKDIASKVLQKNLSELILLATQPIPNSNGKANQFQTSVCKIKIPDDIEVIEAVSGSKRKYFTIILQKKWKTHSNRWPKSGILSNK